MASSFTKVHSDNDYINGGQGGKVEKVYTCSLGAYATGGEAIDLATNMSLPGAILDVKVEENGGGRTYEFRYDYANNKLLAYVAATEAEVANATDLSGVSVRCRVLCASN